VTPLNRKDAIIRGFVKRDRVHPDDFEEKAPRFISPRDPRYGILLATYTKPIEDKLFSKRDHYGLPYFAKGRNQAQRYRIIRKKFELFHNTQVTSIDASKWDAHVNSFQLLLERIVYTTGHNDALLNRLLDMQVINKIVSSYGLKIQVLARRMSGDMNTALGNCIIVFCLLKVFIRLHGLKKHMTFFDDGDDCLIFSDEYGSRFVPLLVPYFDWFGHVLKMENVAKEFCDIIFCQCSPFESRQIMIRPWAKVISHAFVSNKHYTQPTIGLRVMKAICLAELSLNPGVPIVSRFFNEWNNRLCVKAADLRFVDEGLRRRVSIQDLERAKYIAPTIEDRQCFSDITGLSPQEQLAIETNIVDYVQSYPLDRYVLQSQLHDGIQEGSGIFCQH